MSKVENYPAYDTWDEHVKATMTPEEIAEMKFHAALTWELCKLRDEGKITVAELERIEEIEEPEIWLDTVLKVLFSSGKTLAVVPVERDIAS